MELKIIKADITKTVADAIVNAANTSLLGGGGMDGAIHRAGGSAILEECQRIRNRQGGCKTGEAVITTAGNLAARYVIHAVGPVWQGGNNNEPQLLHNAYWNSLLLAESHSVKSIAFPNISTGIYRFPKQLAADIALKAINQFSEHSILLETVTIVCFDADSKRIYLDLMGS